MRRWRLWFLALMTATLQDKLKITPEECAEVRFSFRAGQNNFLATEELRIVNKCSVKKNGHRINIATRQRTFSQ